MKKLFSVFTLASVALLSGCATDESAGYNPDDPFENYNRRAYAFSDFVDQLALKPVAQGYQKVTPQPVQTCVSNFFNNLREPVRAVSHLLVLNPRNAWRSTERFVINTGAGALGCIDISGGLGNQHVDNDLGLVYRYWAGEDAEPQPFLMLPLLGPSTPVDITALYLESEFLDPLSWSRKDGEGVSKNARNGQPWIRRNPYDISDPNKRKWVYALRILDLRAGLLDSTDFIDEVALDRYEFTRDAWREQRAGKALELADQ